MTRRHKPLIDAHWTPQVAQGFCQHSAAVTAARLASGRAVSTAALAHLAQASHD